MQLSWFLFICKTKRIVLFVEYNARHFQITIVIVCLFCCLLIEPSFLQIIHQCEVFVKSRALTINVSVLKYLRRSSRYRGYLG